MIETMERKHRKWLALVILLSLVTVLIAVTVLPVWSANRHYQHQIVELEGQLEQKGRAAALGTRLQAQYDRLKRSQAAITHTLKSNSPALAGAELQGIVKRIAAAKNAGQSEAMPMAINRKNTANTTEENRVANKRGSRTRSSQSL